MSLVQGFPYFKVPFIMPVGTDTGLYSPADPVAIVEAGDYLTVFNFAIVGSTNGSSIQRITPFVLKNAQGQGVGDIIMDSTRSASATIDSEASFPATPCIIRRNLVNTFSVSAPTPIFIEYRNQLAAGTTQSSSTDPQDAFYNFIHFVKLS